MATVGAARGQRGLTWTVDSGAGLHMANKHEVKDAGFSVEPVDDYFVQGVGGLEKCDAEAYIHCKELQSTIRSHVSEGPFNLMSVHLACRENKLCFLELGHLGLPPYILLRGQTKAVVCKIEGDVPIYRQSDPDQQPEPVVHKHGFQCPFH